MLRYLNEFVKLSCAPYLLARKLFPNAKEISESMGMYSAVRDIRMPMGMEYSDPSITVVVVGDGHTPRTAALFAMRSKWQALSIDPMLRKTEWGIDRLTCIPKKVEDCETIVNERSILVLPHAHVNIPDCLHVVPNVELVVALPCCVPITWDREPTNEYWDECIFSPENKIKIWI